MRRRATASLAWAVAAILFARLAAFAALADEPVIRLAQAWARQMSAGADDRHGGVSSRRDAAVYVRISNLGKESDALLSAGSDVARAVELHETVREGGDIRMRALSRIAIPADGKVEMKPGGTFIMLRGLTRDLNRGDKVKITLTFERARPISFQAPVLEAPSASPSR